MKICQTCSKENHSNYVDLCQSCYNKQWFASIPVRNCNTCQKTYKNFGINCHTCSRVLREANRVCEKCSHCLRDKIKIINRSSMLCGKCYRNKCDNEIPGYKEKRILNNRKSHRKYRGHEPDGPLRRKAAGEGYINKHGYKIIARVGHPNANKDKGAIPEHVWVMSEYMGRPLKKGESVHHKNGIRDDNRIENLEIWHRAQPAGQKLEDKIRYFKEFLIEYGYKILDP
jgi:hypothetical protein